MKKVLLIVISILLLTGCNKVSKGNDSIKEISSNEEFKENVYKYLVDKNYLDEPNLDTFEIKDIIKKGQYKTNSNIVYFKYECNYKCKDGTDSCILNNAPTDQKAVWLYKSNDGEGYYFFLEYDLKNDKVLGKKGTYGPDSDFKQIIE